jgi:S1-C subfamily serine protease
LSLHKEAVFPYSEQTVEGVKLHLDVQSTDTLRPNSFIYGEKQNKSRFGLHFTDLTTDQRKQYGRKTGIVVCIVVEETSAFDANIVPGDLIISIGGKSTRGKDHAVQLLCAIPQSVDNVIFEVIRNNIEKNIEVSLVQLTTTQK